MKLLKQILLVIFGGILAISAVLAVALNYKTVLASRKNIEIIDAAGNEDDLTIPENVSIVGLGEASHGSVEFQESKLEVFKQLVEKYDFSAFALEADFGDCLEANAYVQGADGDARQIANNFDFTIYHTVQMADIIEWMRQYNASVSEDKQLRFYGFDMQDPEDSVKFLYDFMEKNQITGQQVSAIDYLVDENRTDRLTEEDVQKIKEELSSIKSAIENSSADKNDFDTIAALKITDNVAVCAEYSIQDYREMNSFRDSAMAENVSWILDLEKKLGSGKILITAHDGHIGKKVQSWYLKNCMGGILKETYGDEYYCIGTDFFKGKSNIRSMMEIIPGKNGRKNYYVTTADKIAYQAKYMDDKSFFMDFSSISQDKSKRLYDLVHSDVNMGTLGEGFADYYYLFHSSYRISMPPADLYDGMIYYYEVSAISPEL